MRIEFSQAVMDRKNEVKACEDRLRVAQENLRAAQVAEFPVKEGDVVIHQDKEFLVSEIYKPEYGWITARKKKKNGEWGHQTTTLFDWEPKRGD